MSCLAKRGCLIATLLVITTALLTGGFQPSASGQGAGRPTPTPRPARRAPTTSRRTPPAETRRPTQPIIPRNAPEIEVVLIPGGTFMMGAPESKEALVEETPQHRVTVPSFYLGKYKVTQAQWRAVMGTNPSHFKGDNYPVENVSWVKAVEFCRTLSLITGRGYRLPSEAEWEYACRAGGTGDYRNNADSVAWHFDSLGGKMRPVGEKQPNGFGVYDMIGLVREWVADFRHDNYYGAPADGSAWTDGGNPNYRIARGASWLSAKDFRSFRCSDRVSQLNSPTDSSDQTGFRVVAVSQQ